MWRPSRNLPLTRAIQRKLHQTIKRVSDDFQGRWHFNTCISAIMELVNALYSMKNYGAAERPRPPTATATKIPPSWRSAAQILSLLLAPFAPYLAHELWEMLGEKGSLLKAAWPTIRLCTRERRRTRNPGADQRQTARPRYCARGFVRRLCCRSALSPTKK